MNRAPRAAAMGVLLLSPIALGACSAGQVAQTATQDRDKYGSMVNLGDLALRGLELPYPTGGVYPGGSDARLLGAVASNASSDDTLVSIEGEDFDSVEVVDPAAADQAATGSGSGSLDLTVPANGTLYLSNGTGPAVTLIGLADDIGVGQSVEVTFTFEEAGEVSIAVPVGVASRDLPRGEPFDFEGGDESGGGSGEAAPEQQGGGQG